MAKMSEQTLMTIALTIAAVMLLIAVLFWWLNAYV
jgi:hypothetical protein